MKVAIMQPYLFPYIGYFQLLHSVDLFVVYDNIKYTKKGWINRNRFLQNGREEIFSVPLKKDSDSLHVKYREVSQDFNRDKFLNKLKGAYQRAPYFESIFPLIEKIVRDENSGLFRYLHNSLTELCIYLGINTKIIISSEVSIDHSLKGQDKVLAICKELAARTYINAIGGINPYDRKAFQSKGLELKFLRSKAFEYEQFDHDFVPWLSIIDVMMFNSIETINERLASGYDLL